MRAASSMFSLLAALVAVTDWLAAKPAPWAAPPAGPRRSLLPSHDRLDPATFARVLGWLHAGDPAARSAPPTWTGAVARDLARRRRPRGPSAARRLLRLMRQQRRARARTARAH